MNPSYIAKNLEELFEQAPPKVKEIIESGEIDTVTTALGEKYKVPVGAYVALSNVISFILIGALKPEDVVKALTEIVGTDQATSQKIAEDLEKGILQKVRNATLGKDEPVAKLTFKGDGKDEALRKELLDTTKRESGLTKEQSSGTPAPKQSVITPGSRNQLLEQLQVLSTIPNDDEVEGRLKHIQEQLAELAKKEEEKEPDVVKVPAKVYNFGDKGGEIVAAVKKPASYSTAPTEYNVDPYREVTED